MGPGILHRNHTGDSVYPRWGFEARHLPASVSLASKDVQSMIDDVHELGFLAVRGLRPAHARQLQSSYDWKSSSAATAIGLLPHIDDGDKDGITLLWCPDLGDSETRMTSFSLLPDAVRAYSETAHVLLERTDVPSEIRRSIDRSIQRLEAHERAGTVYKGKKPHPAALRGLATIRRQASTIPLSVSEHWVRAVQEASKAVNFTWTSGSLVLASTRVPHFRSDKRGTADVVLFADLLRQ